MKKIISMVLAFAMLLSVFALSGCSTDKELDRIYELTEPGKTYKLFGTEDNPLSGSGASYIRMQNYPSGEGRTYVSKVDAFGYEKVGFKLALTSMYLEKKFPFEFSDDASATLNLTIGYSTYISNDQKLNHTIEDIIVTVDLDKTGITTFEYATAIDEAIANNPYCKYAFDVKVLSCTWESFTGTITFLEPTAE